MGRGNSLKLARGYAPPKTRSATRARSRETVTGNLCRRDCVTTSFPALWVVSFLGLRRVAHDDRPRYNAVLSRWGKKKIVASAVINGSFAVINRSVKVYCSGAIVNKVTLFGLIAKS